jgi:hypothetical protein
MVSIVAEIHPESQRAGDTDSATVPGPLQPLADLPDGFATRPARLKGRSSSSRSAIRICMSCWIRPPAEARCPLGVSTSPRSALPPYGLDALDDRRRPSTIQCQILAACVSDRRMAITSAPDGAAPPAWPRRPRDISARDATGRQVQH